MKRLRGGATRRALAAAALLVVVLAQAGAGLGQGVQVVAVFPLATYSREPIQPVADRVMEGLAARFSRIQRLVLVDQTRVQQALQGHRGALSDEAVRAMGQRLGADVVLIGSLTRLGETYSLDLRVVPTRRREGLTAFLQGRGVEGLLGQIEPFAHTLNERLAAVGTGAPASSTGVVVSLPPGLRQGPGPAPAPGGAAVAVPRPIFPRASASTITSTRSWSLCGEGAAEVLALGAGDFTGTQAGMVALLGTRGVGLYRLGEDGLRRIAYFPAAAAERFLSLDVADLNRNGRDELYVIAHRNGRMESAVLEWDGSSLRRVVEGLPWTLRIATLPKTGPILLGQAEPDGGAIYRLMWQEGRLVPDVRLSLPMGADVQSLAFGTSGPRGNAEVLFLDVEGHLRICQGPSCLMRSEALLPASAPGSAGAGTPGGAGPAWGSRRVIARADSAVPGTLVVVKRRRAPQPGTQPQQAEVVGLSWNGVELEELWRLDADEGEIADFAVLDQGGRRSLLVFARPGRVGGACGALLRYDLDRGAGTPAAQSPAQKP